MATSERDRVGIFIFDGVEVLDFCGPLEVFFTSNHFEVVTVARTTEPVRAVTGLQVTPDHGFDDCPPLNILVVPGGQGTRPLQHDEEVHGWLRQQFEDVDLFTTVCTGSVLAASAGLLQGLEATTHWGSLRRLEEYEGVRVNWDSRIVDQGRVVSSAGISAGIDMALYVLETRYGRSVMQRAVNVMEYDAYPGLKPNFHRPTFVTRGVETDKSAQ